MKKVIMLFALSLGFLCNGQVKDSVKVDNFQKTDEVLAEVVKKALVVAEKTGDFVIEQAPMLLREFYAWHILSDIIFILIGFLTAYTLYRIPLLWLDKEEDNCSDIKYFSRWGDDGAVAGWVVFIVGAISGGIMIICNLYDLIYIIVAPKLYLIDYFIK